MGSEIDWFVSNVSSNEVMKPFTLRKLGKSRPIQSYSVQFHELKLIQIIQSKPYKTHRKNFTEKKLPNITKK